MSVSLFRYDADGECTLCYPVSTEDVYIRVWNRAIAEENFRLFRECSGFTVEQVSEVLDELQRIKDWCERNLDHSSRDYSYMIWRPDDLMQAIPEEAEKSSEPFEL